ncbi:MAG: transcriptional regulator [Ectothiorhodospiraceae bacterium]|nr:transcriptional regulator [Ectothiorhodospiraceae bacterium]
MIGDELRKARQAKEMSQEELAHRAKISRNYVSLLELGQKSPTVDMLMRICAALGISAGELLLKVEGKKRR